jgi:hypothetical protein
MEAMKDSARLRALVHAIVEERSSRRALGVKKLDAVP